MQVSRLGVHLGLARPANDDVAQHRQPSARPQHVVGSTPSDRRVDPVPGRCRHHSVEAAPPVVPGVERRAFDVDVAEVGQSASCELGHAVAWLDGGNGAGELGKRTGCLTGAAPNLEHVRAGAKAGEVGQIPEQAGG